MKSRDAVGDEYGMTGRNIARYMRINQLESQLKKRLDDGKLSMVAAVNLSYLSAKEQETISELAEQGRIKLDEKAAKYIKNMAGEVTEKYLLKGLEHKGKKKADICKNIKLSADVYEKYFFNVKETDVAGIVESALTAWFKKEGIGDY